MRDQNTGSSLFLSPTCVLISDLVMAQQVRAVTVLAEDPSSGPSTEVVAHSHLSLQFQLSFSRLLRRHMHVIHMVTLTHTHTHTHKYTYN